MTNSKRTNKKKERKEMLYRLVKKEDSFCLSAALHTVQ